MNKKNKNISKVCVVLYILLLVVNLSKVYALDEQIIERQYKKIETEDGIFYKMKDLNEIYDMHIAVNSSGISTEIYDDFLKLNKIIQEKVDAIIKDYISKDYPEEQKIREDYNIWANKIYSLSKEKPYSKGDDIVAVVQIFAHPIDGSNNYWQDNFTKNELYYDKYKDEYNVYVYYYVRLSMNQKTGEYEVVYIDSKPEAYEQSIKELKENGFDLENLDVKKILNTNYADEIKAISSENTILELEQESEYNSNQIQEIENMSNVIRYICIVFLIIALILIIKFRKK